MNFFKIKTYFTDYFFFKRPIYSFGTRVCPVLSSNFGIEMDFTERTFKLYRFFFFISEHNFFFNFT
jgi:hypothetical protein